MHSAVSGAHQIPPSGALEATLAHLPFEAASPQLTQVGELVLHLIPSGTVQVAGEAAPFVQVEPPGQRLIGEKLLPSVSEQEQADAGLLHV